jgi:hypothetical protein
MRTAIFMQLQEYTVAKIFWKRLPICTVATAYKAMYKYCGTVSNPFKPDKMLLKALHYPLFLYTSKSTVLFEGSQAAPACPSQNNSGMILKRENTYRSTCTETRSLVSVCPPQISDE